MGVSTHLLRQDTFAAGIPCPRQTEGWFHSSNARRVHPWVLMLGIIRRAVGDNWNDMRHQLAYLDYALVAAALVGAVYLVHRRRRARRLVVA